MKKRKNIIISAITCLFSICLMMFGVYAASNPSVSISGQVSYSARDAKVLVLGKVNGQAGDDSNVDYPSVTDATNPTESAVSLPAQYLGYTKGDSAGSTTDNLPQWNMGTTAHAFYEDSTGIRPIVISFKMTNLSNYPVVATVDFTGVTDANLASKNLTRETTGLKESKVYLDKNVTKEISVTYSVANDAVGVNGDGLLNMSITFEKTVFPTPSNVKSPQGETMQSDWEYSFDGESFAITRYKKTRPLEGETFEDPTIPTELVIPSKVVCSDGKTYPVKTIGGATEKDVEDAGDDESKYMEIMMNGPVIVDFMTFFSFETDEEMQNYVDSLPNIVISEGIELINVFALAYTNLNSLPSSIKEVCQAGCNSTSIETLNCPNLLKIGRGAFTGNKLKTVVLSSNMKNLGAGAFSDCGALQSVTLPEGLESIGEDAFYNCYFLPSITIPSTVKQIGKEAFRFCFRLGEIINKSDLEATDFLPFHYNGEVCSVRIVTSGESQIRTINDYKYVTGNDGKNYMLGYYGTQSDLSLPTDVDYELIDSMFSYCANQYVTPHSLKSIIIPSNIKEIKYGMFMNCKDLKTVTISENITNIDPRAFMNCSSLETVTIKAVTPPTLGYGIFDECTNLVNIYVPSASVDAYKAADGWKDLADKIVGIV